MPIPIPRSIEDVTKIFNSVRVNFRTEMKRIGSSERSGAGSEGFFFLFGYTSSIRMSELQLIIAKLG